MADKQFVVKISDMTAHVEAPKGAKGSFALVSKVEDLGQFDDDQLAILVKNVKGDPKAKNLAQEAFDVFMKTVPAEKKTGGGKKSGPSKMDLIRTTLKEKGTMPRADLAALIGSDEPNIHTMISILKNAKRTKDPIFVSYDKAEKTYTWYNTAKQLQAAEEKAAKAAEKAAAVDKDSKK